MLLPLGGSWTGSLILSIIMGSIGYFYIFTVFTLLFQAAYFFKFLRHMKFNHRVKIIHVAFMVTVVVGTLGVYLFY